MGEGETIVGRTAWDFLTDMMFRVGPWVVIVGGILFGGYYYLEQFTNLQLKTDQMAFERISLAQRNTIDLSEKMSTVTEGLLSNITATLELNQKLRAENEEVQQKLIEIRLREDSYIRAIKSLNQMENEINEFILSVYMPEFTKQFADEFKLSDRIKNINRDDPRKLQPMMVAFVQRSLERVDKRRRELLNPVNRMRESLVQANLLKGRVESFLEIKKLADISARASEKLDAVLSRARSGRGSLSIPDKIDGVVRGLTAPP